MCQRSPLPAPLIRFINYNLCNNARAAPTLTSVFLRFYLPDEPYANSYLIMRFQKILNLHQLFIRWCWLPFWGYWLLVANFTHSNENEARFPSRWSVVAIYILPLAELPFILPLVSFHLVNAALNAVAFSPPQKYLTI